MPSTTRRIVLAALTLAVSAACSSDGSTSTSTTTAGAATVTIEHAGGTTALSAIPSRVVVLDDAMLGDLSSFGVVPVGIAAGTDGRSMLSVWGPDLGTDEIEVVSPGFEPNLEAIANVHPDLILAMAWQVEEPYWDDLNELAPTIALETDVDPLAPRDIFTENLHVYGQIFGQDELADQLAAEYDERFAAEYDEFGDVIEGTTVSLAGSLNPGTFRVIGPRQFSGSILDGLGLTFPQIQLDAIEANADYPVEAEVSDELTPEYLSTDLIIWREYDRSDDAVAAGFPAAALEANPLLAAVPAAEAGRVFTVSNTHWYLRSVRGRLLVLDQLEAEILPSLSS